MRALENVTLGLLGELQAGDEIPDSYLDHLGNTVATDFERLAELGVVDPVEAAAKREDAADRARHAQSELDRLEQLHNDLLFAAQDARAAAGEVLAATDALKAATAAIVTATSAPATAPADKPAEKPAAGKK